MTPASSKCVFVDEFIRESLRQHVDGDAARFDELWALVPDFGQRLRSFDSDSAWLHWAPKTFDGWYCVAAPAGYSVYYQERGFVGQRWFFVSERAAARFAINASVLKLPQLPAVSGT